MSKQTLTPEARRNVVLFGGASFGIGADGVKKYKKQKDGKTVLVLENVPVFRSGTFRDSMGYQHAWDDIHMTQMVNHWNLLRDQKIVESVPVKKGHGSLFGDPMDSLIGWHSNVKTEKRTNPIDGKEYTYLLADYEILDSDAIDKVESGLWRNLSSEISSYVTNDEMEFWPVYSGVAYVDFSAVEGLREFSKNNKSNMFSLMFENESEAPAVGDQNNNGPAQQGTSGTGAGQPQQTQPPVTQQPPADNQPPADQQVQPPADESQTAGTEQTQGEQTDHSKGGTLFCFKLNGTPTVGVPIAGLSGTQLQAFMSAQAHIDSLEQYRTEQIKVSREDFVKGLAAGQNPAILASTIPSLTEAALEMSDSAFAKWSAAMKASAPPSNTAQGQLFQQHGAPSGDTPQPQAQVEADNLQEQIDIQEAIIADHRRSGFSQERLEKLGSYQKLQQLRAQQNKTTQS